MGNKAIVWDVRVNPVKYSLYEQTMCIKVPRYHIHLSVLELNQVCKYDAKVFVDSHGIQRNRIEEFPNENFVSIMIHIMNRDICFQII